ncbi:Gfo/Idh/MocA family oxidoreductase [Methanosarcina mazei]|nr:Gfo/Idh/MocA family oxidoreductase [Methanosarcina mazei]
MKGLSAASGLSCESVAKKYGFEYCTSDYHKILSDPEINCVSIVTRNSLHASLVIEALKNKKKDHWVYDESEGGSRIITECCHFIDFMQFIIGSSPMGNVHRLIKG